MLILFLSVQGHFVLASVLKVSENGSVQMVKKKKGAIVLLEITHFIQLEQMLRGGLIDPRSSCTIFHVPKTSRAKGTASQSDEFPPLMSPSLSNAY